MEMTAREIRKLLPKCFTRCYTDRKDNRYVYIEADLNKIEFDEANKIINNICKKFKFQQISAGVDFHHTIRDWIIKIKEDIRDKIAFLLKDKEYSDIFSSVRQRCAAFKYYMKYCIPLRKAYTMDEYLDDAYRFLNQHIDPNFILYCAKKENMEPLEYIQMLVEIDDAAIQTEQEKKPDKFYKLIKYITQLQTLLSDLEGVIAGARPFLTLYDGGVYDNKSTLLEKIHKAREILESRDKNNTHIIDMFKDWNSKFKDER